MSENIIQVNGLSKVYRLYDKKSDRLKEAVSLTNKKYYKEFYALRDISFEVGRGETVGIIGTNGSGKSTLLKILTGVISATSGSAEVKGKISALLELGTGFNPEYTGIENIMLNGTMMGYTSEQMKARVDSIVEFADIGDYINQPVKNYSSGMFARLAFAVAISVEPEILIVDEALSVGDVFFQNKCFRKFAELREMGATVLFVSHDIGSIRRMCSRVLWIEQGEQMMFGPSNDVCIAYFNAQMGRMNRETEEIVKTMASDSSSDGQTEDAALQCPRITPASNSVLSDKVEIISTYVKNTRGKIVYDLYEDHTYSICIACLFKEKLDNVIVGFNMVNVKGIGILSTNTFVIDGCGFSVQKGTVMEVSFTFQIPRVRSGQYEICPAVALGTQQNHMNLSWLYGVLCVSVIRNETELSEIGADYSTNKRNYREYELY